MPCVTGIDTSLTSTGFAVVADGYVHFTESFKSKGKRGDTLEQRNQRISRLANDVIEAVILAEPDLVVIESPSFGSKHGSAHDRSGLWWLVVQACHEIAPLVATVSPKQRAKYATGNGNSQKPEVFAAVKERYGETEAELNNDDEGDALLLAAMGARWLGEPVDGPLAPRFTDALTKAAWPREETSS